MVKSNYRFEKNNLNKNVIKKSIKDAIISSIKSGVTTIGQISSYNGIDIPIINKYGIRCCYFYEIAILIKITL